MNDPTHDDRPIHFGFSVGVNFMDYRIEHSEAADNAGVFIGLEEVLPGFTVNAIVNLRITENFDFRTLPGISFGERHLYYIDSSGYGNSIYPEPGSGRTSYYKSPSSYIEIPVCLKYKAKRLNNFRPYLIGGANFRWDLTIKDSYDDEDQLIMTDVFNAFGEVGTGMDFYMTYFKLGIEIKYSFGLWNILNRTNSKGEIDEELAHFTDYIDKITAHMVVVSFHFE